MAAPEPKRQRTHPNYELLYHPTIPGRGEYVRLVFEAAGVPYSDPANEDQNNGYPKVQAICDANSTGDEEGNPPAFAPPALRVPGAGKDGKSLLICQTPNIVEYIAPKVGLAPADEVDRLHANQLMLTALDMSNEAHDTHHPVAVMLYYEDQKEESSRKAKDFRESRIPKFFSYFERVLKGNKQLGKGKYLIGDKLSYADTTWWQVVDGLHFAFPKEMEARKKEFPLLFATFYPSFKEEKGIKEYLASERRLKYSMGLYRHYPELDRQ
ncbi:uncharacterized protein K452DRAFT_231908 [Aplosporella prunicola CBS 121167]|uniref:Glutathione S-transferase n=1 Tax=Aplosporella prunicola CBS 121167 TaxID=1176127 RepID=A0A6A6B8P1_9PEZI|nr:uncharacterized protein K452DRAFT_231908 [Aplosporella prunicola CBS 121167]KAF2139645.1 hypothetical protein K452DRAFT_231908 [Aplosporella prunicola CBS 121167]